jgi:hypothetical protein
MGMRLVVGLAWLLSAPSALHAATAAPPGIAVVKVRVIKTDFLPEDREQTECCLIDGPNRSHFKIVQVYAGHIQQRSWIGEKNYLAGLRVGVESYEILRESDGPQPTSLAFSWAYEGACITPDDTRAAGVEAVIERLKRAHPCKLKLVQDAVGQRYISDTDD